MWPNVARAPPRPQPLIDAAEQAGGGDRCRYLLGDMQDLAGVKAESFDLAVSYVSLLDVPDLAAAVAEAHRAQAGRSICVLQLGADGDGNECAHG